MKTKSKIFFTADSHFYHRLILKYRSQFNNSLEQMHKTIIENWNTIVSPKDTIYCLGDMGLGTSLQMIEILKQLNGHKCLITGNHDRFNAEYKKQFIWIKDYYRLKIDTYRLILFHYPIYSWHGKETNAIHLHAHVHQNSHHDVGLHNKINVGMDIWDFKPISLQQILDTIWERAPRYLKTEENRIFYNQKENIKKENIYETEYNGT